MQGAGGSYPMVLPKLNAAQLLAFLKSLNGLPNPFFCSALPCATPFNLASTLPQANPFNSYDVTEKTTSFYVEATFAGTDWSGQPGRAGGAYHHQCLDGGVRANVLVDPLGGQLGGDFTTCSTAPRSRSTRVLPTPWPCRPSI